MVHPPEFPNARGVSHVSDDLVDAVDDMLERALLEIENERARHYVREARQLLEGVAETAEPVPPEDD